MKDSIERITNQLLEANSSLSYNQARTWIELLWEDFEATYAKAGHPYRGHEMTERIVSGWVTQYGERLHEFVANNPKYKELLNVDGGMKH